MEIPSADMPQSDSRIELSDCDTSSLGLSSVEVREDDDARRLPYSDRLADRVVTGNLDVDNWIWIIEYLAKFKKELWMLHDVFEMGPKVPDYLGEHANEMVAFRCLAYLFDPTPEQDSSVASGAESKVEFDLSESCEYVLQCILDEIPLSDLKPGAPELSKWNLLPFIERKRLCLPKCALELLREASCEKRSGKFPSNGQEKMRIDGNKNDQVAAELPGQNIVENLERRGKSFGQDPRNADGVSGERNDPSCCKKNRCDITIPDSLEENDEGNQVSSLVDENICAKADESQLDPTDATVDNDNEHTTEAGKGIDLSNNNQEGRMEASRSPVNDNSESVALMELQGTSDATDGNGHVQSSDNVSILPLAMASGITVGIAGLEALGKHPSIEVSESEDQRNGKDHKQTDSLLEAVSIDKNNLNQHEMIDGAVIDGCPSSPSVYKHTCKQCEKAPLAVGMPAGHLSRMGISSSNRPTHGNSTVELLVGETSLGMLSAVASTDDDTSSDGLQRLSCSDRLRNRVVTGDLDIDIWIWIIEYFAKFKKELWALHDVFEMAPRLPHYLGKYTNEMVAFRCLAYLFDLSPRQKNDATSRVESKVEFESSESCEHVLQCILDEIPLLELKPGATGLLKWNLLPFIENKRLHLPKCTLELLREASHEKSSGVFPSDGQETRSINSNKSDQVVPGFAGENIVAKVNNEEKSFGQDPKIGDGELEHGKETSLGKADICDVVIPDTVEENEDGNQDTYIAAEAKESKADATPDNAHEHTTTATECFDDSNKNQEVRMEVRRSPVDDNEFMASGELQGTGDGDHGNGQTEPDDDILPVGMANGISLSDAGLQTLGNYLSDEPEESDDLEKGKPCDSLSEAPSSDNTDLSQCETVDDHLSSPSQCRYTCKQCATGGKLLFCSNEGCLVMIHEKCLDSPPAYDDDGNFYCPLCAYTLDSSEYLKSMAQVAEAKKKLIRFFNLVNSKKGRSGNQVPSSQH